MLNRELMIQSILKKKRKSNIRGSLEIKIKALIKIIEEDKIEINRSLARNMLKGIMDLIPVNWHHNFLD